ncbi:MAG TPA: hypothetical protein VF735_18945 [Pyrinomonadaceae bacterium]|jgi:hypothetical protein
MKIIRALLLVMALAVSTFADDIPNGIESAGYIPNGITSAGETPNNVTAADDIPNGLDLLFLLTLMLR